MNVTINGKSTQLSDVKTIADLIRSRGLKTSLVAVEQNGSIVPRSEFESKPVEEGDELEIVHFVGGG
ncbi:MAG: sulfur carrier protein ThiS [Nitrolancea sp.]